MSKLKHKYSGPTSWRFWNQINAIKNKAKRNEAYSLGVILQNVECDVIRLINLLKP